MGTTYSNVHNQGGQIVRCYGQKESCSTNVAFDRTMPPALSGLIHSEDFLQNIDNINEAMKYHPVVARIQWLIIPVFIMSFVVGGLVPGLFGIAVVILIIGFIILALFSRKALQDRNHRVQDLITSINSSSYRLQWVYLQYGGGRSMWYIIDIYRRDQVVSEASAVYGQSAIYAPSSSAYAPVNQQQTNQYAYPPHHAQAQPAFAQAQPYYVTAQPAPHTAVLGLPVAEAVVASTYSVGNQPSPVLTHVQPTYPLTPYSYPPTYSQLPQQR